MAFCSKNLGESGDIRMIVLLENECSLSGGVHTLLLKKELLALSGSGDVKTLSMCPRAFTREPGTAPVVIPTLPVPPLANLYVYRYKCFCLFFFLIFGGHKSFLRGHWYPCFELFGQMQDLSRFRMKNLGDHAKNWLKRAASSAPSQVTPHRTIYHSTYHIHSRLHVNKTLFTLNVFVNDIFDVFNVVCEQSKRNAFNTFLNGEKNGAKNV